MAAADWSGERAAKEKEERVALRVGVSATLRQSCFKKGDDGDGGSDDDGEVGTFYSNFPTCCASTKKVENEKKSQNK